jgi:hypothetical protein
MKFQARDRKLAEFRVLSLLAARTPMIVKIASGTTMAAPVSFFDLSVMQMVASLMILIVLYAWSFKVMSSTEL